MLTSPDGSPPGPNGVSSATGLDLTDGAYPGGESGGGGDAETADAPAKNEVLQLPDFLAVLPEQIWYLTSSGQEMWCRRPYGFFFSTSEAAIRFAAQVGSAFDLTPIGVSSKELVSQEGIDAMQKLGVRRLFIDPRIEPQSGDVFGRILRIEPRQQAS